MVREQLMKFIFRANSTYMPNHYIYWRKLCAVTIATVVPVDGSLSSQYLLEFDVDEKFITNNVGFLHT